MLLGSLAVTGYCYDNRGNLAVVIPPEAYKQLGAGKTTSFTESDEIFKKLCFGYHFDTQNRQIEVHIPGAGWKYFVFDKHDRNVAFADDSDKAKGYWQFRKFDALGKIIQTGLLNGKGSKTRTELQTAFDGHTGDSFEVVTRPSGAGGLLGYVPELVGRTIETVGKPKIEPVLERVVRTSGGKHEWDSKLTPKENVKQHWEKGNAAHKEVQKGWKEEGFKTEHQLSKDSRTDGIKVDEATKVGTIRELKPNTPTGIKDGNAQLGLYIDRATTKYPDVNRWIPELHLYSTPPVVIPFKPN